MDPNSLQIQLFYSILSIDYSFPSIFCDSQYILLQYFIKLLANSVDLYQAAPKLRNSLILVCSALAFCPNTLGKY